MKVIPVLSTCGGYTLLRLAEISHNMVEIEGPDNGVAVRYLKDILNQTKLYVTDEDMKPFLTPDVSFL